jgi:hypothetical protein
MMFQWAAAIVAAVWIAPRTWAGQYSHIHLHVWVSIFLGGLSRFFRSSWSCINREKLVRATSLRFPRC